MVGASVGFESESDLPGTSIRSDACHWTPRGQGDVQCIVVIDDRVAGADRNDLAPAPRQDDQV